MFENTKNFTRKELEASTIALREGIDNSLPVELESNAQELVNALQKFRDVIGKPITITSGYRCEELNKLVGGVKNSSHTKAWAADITVNSWSAEELFFWLSGYLKGSKMKFGQLLLEHNSKTTWVHFSIKDNGKQKCQIKELYV